MKNTEYTAILSAVEQAIKICDSYGDRMDAARRKICEDLHRLRADLLRQIRGPGSELS